MTINIGLKSIEFNSTIARPLNWEAFRAQLRSSGLGSFGFRFLFLVCGKVKIIPIKFGLGRNPMKRQSVRQRWNHYETRDRIYRFDQEF